MIDSHVHFWNYHPVKDAWITEDMKVIRRNFAPADLQKELTENGVSGCIAVQADQSEEETNFLLNYAQQFPFIRGVVGWTNLKAKDLPKKLAQYAAIPAIKGWRHIVQAEADGFMDDTGFRNGIALLAGYDYTYDILIQQHQLPEASRLVKDFPNQKFILDHLAKPSIKTKENDEIWAKNISHLAQFPNIYCKISGMVTEADWTNWKETDFKFYLDTVFECFGVHRLLYGSDWPVCTLAGNYAKVKSIIMNYINSLSKLEQNAVLEMNAINFYLSK